MAEVRTHLINRERVRCALAGEWRDATKEHSHRSVTEEQRCQPPASAQPAGWPFFCAVAALLVGQRSLRIFSLLAPSHSAKSLATHPLPIYEMGSRHVAPIGNRLYRRVLTGSGRLPGLFRSDFGVCPRALFKCGHDGNPRKQVDREKPVNRYRPKRADFWETLQQSLEKLSPS